MVWDIFAKNMLHQFQQEKILVGHRTEVFIPIDGWDVSISPLSGDFTRVEGLLIMGSDAWGQFSSKILDEKHETTSWGEASSSSTVPHANYAWFWRKRMKGVSSLGNTDSYLRRMLALFLMSEWRVPFFFNRGRPLVFAAGISHIFRMVMGRLFLSIQQRSHGCIWRGFPWARCRFLSAGIGIWPCFLFLQVCLIVLFMHCCLCVFFISQLSARVNDVVGKVSYKGYTLPWARLGFLTGFPVFLDRAVVVGCNEFDDEVGRSLPQLQPLCSQLLSGLFLGVLR